MNWSEGLYFFVGLVLALWLAGLRSRRRNPKRLPLPPGPKGYPIIGNLLDMPTHKPWLVYDQWFGKYGDIIHLNVMGRTFIILGSLSRTTDLFEKRSSVYSDRPRFPMLNELMGQDFNMTTLPYGPWWRRHRRLFHEHFHNNAILKYQPVQMQEARKFLLRLRENPEDFSHHIRHNFAAMIMKIAYGINVAESDDPYISTAEEALRGISEAGGFGQFWVDLFPVLKYIPAWVPGAKFKRLAAHWKTVNIDMSDKPWNEVKASINKGTDIPSVSRSIIEALPDADSPERVEEERLGRDTAAIAYIGGSDTTVSAAQSFFMEMAMHPDVQQKAQAEIDAVVGLNRLPEFSDRDSLPYINAIVKETFRWQNIIPTTFVHATSRDDEYDGYFIPKGALVMGNAWSILHDPQAYTQPEKFQPERFLVEGQLDPRVRDPQVAAFGYGRRMCPGRHLADNSMFSIVSSVLAVYDILPPVDEQGHPIQLQPNMSSGFISYPLPFQCIIRPRSVSADTLIQSCRNMD